MATRTALFSRRQAGGVFTIADIEKHPGNIYFVDSATGANTAANGHNPDSPFASLSYAFSSDVLAAGDTVYLLPGHNESIGDAQVTLDIAGVTVVGLGRGSLTPRVDYDHANASIDVAASNITLRNLRLLPSVTAVLIGIDINTLCTDTLLEDIEILPGEDGAGVDEFAIAIDLKVGCNRTVIRRIKHRQHASAAGSVSSISFTGASDDITIEDGFFDMAGAALVAPINGITTLSTGIYIRRCTFVTDAAEPGFELITGSTGVAENCLVFSNHATLAGALVGDGIARFRCENIELAAESGGIIGTASVDD